MTRLFYKPRAGLRARRAFVQGVHVRPHRRIHRGSRRFERSRSANFGVGRSPGAIAGTGGLVGGIQAPATVKGCVKLRLAHDRRRSKCYTAGHFELLIDGHKSTAVPEVGRRRLREGPASSTSRSARERSASSTSSTVDVEPFSIEFGISGSNDILEWIQGSWKQEATAAATARSATRTSISSRRSSTSSTTR